jgi:cytoskeletal protein CcmA (bactofilin family)
MIVTMMMMTTTTKLKGKIGGERRLRVFNGGKVKQSVRLENIVIDGQENTKMCVKK